jgi:hypothetical protein
LIGEESKSEYEDEKDVEERFLNVTNRDKDRAGGQNTNICEEDIKISSD